MDEESDLGYVSSKSDIVVECEVTIEEENNSMMNQLFTKEEAIYEVNPMFD